MQSIKVGQMMVPLAEYATVPEEATLNDAILALEAAQQHVAKNRDSHRSVLVLDKKGHVVGKIDQWTVLWAIEPRYKNVGNLKETSRFGFSPGFINSLLETHGLWRTPLEDLCKKAAKINVKEIVQTPFEAEYISEAATLDEAIHQMVMGRYSSLLVKRGESIVGILRQSDVFNEICERIKACHI